MGAMNSRLDLPEEGSVNRNRGPHGQGGAGYAGGLEAPKLAKLDFPCYDGSEDPTLDLPRHHWATQKSRSLGYLGWNGCGIAREVCCN